MTRKPPVKILDCIEHIRTEVAFAERDERDGSATEATRRIRFEWINEAIDRAAKVCASRTHTRKATP